MGGGGTNVLNDNTSNGDYCVTNPPSVPQTSEQCTPTCIRYDSLTATAYFNNTSTVGGGGGLSQPI